jgi:hypothetical protein
MWLVDASFIPMLACLRVTATLFCGLRKSHSAPVLLIDCRLIQCASSRKWVRVHRQYGPLFIYLQSLSSRVRGPLWLGAPRQDSVAEPGQLIRVWDALCAPHPCLHASRAQSVASLCLTRTRDTQRRVAQPAITAPLSSRDATSSRPSVGAIAGFRFCLRTHTSD